MTFLDDIMTSVNIYIVYIEAIGVIAVAVILERVIARHFKRLSKQKEWPPHITNGLLLIFRLLIILSAVATLMRIGGVPPDWLVTISALGGAAIGFASTRTLGNFLAGLFIFITRPFRVHDYVRVDNIEGIVDEITFNYTKIRTQSNTLVYISNLKILDQNIINYKYGSRKPPLYCYSFDLSFSHSPSSKELEEAFDIVVERFSEKLPEKPEYMMKAITAFEKRYLFHLYVRDPKDIFVIQPSFVKEIAEAWEAASRR